MVYPILILARKNFTLIAPNELTTKEFLWKTLHLKRDEEMLSPTAHFIYQAQDLFLKRFVEDGTITTIYTFAYNSALEKRITSSITKNRPLVLLMEFYTYDSAEWAVFQYLLKFKIPILPYFAIPPTAKTITDLSAYSVNDYLFSLDKHSLETKLIDLIHRRD